jgi:hypothetical protein
MAHVDVCFVGLSKVDGGSSGLAKGLMLHVFGGTSCFGTISV